MEIETLDIPEIAKSLAKRQPSEIIQFALENFGGGIGISFSGAEDVVLIDMAAKTGGNFRVFSLDTGRLHSETYQFIDKVREHYCIAVEVFFPKPDAVEKLVKTKGLFSFYEDGHKECCGIRKVEPLKRALATFDAWMTGQRRDQSPSTRAQVAVVEIDRVFSSPDRDLIKFNPLAN
ncbi:MAG: phosphoadenylyl-sulfate reductase, partial [Acidobacteriota bacterium]